EVRACPCHEEQARRFQQDWYAFVRSVEDGSAPARPGSPRQKTLYSDRDPRRRTFTYGFNDADGQNKELGTGWYGYGWLFVFRSQKPLAIEWFPSRYLIEVGKQVNAAKKVPKQEDG